MRYDFSGYATKNDLKCIDGRTIRRNAFKECDGKTVPLVWNHQHNSVDNVLGHGVLENREDGVYVYGYFNNTDGAQRAKDILMHGDIAGLSIWANQLKQNGGDVLHGTIREVSLVLAGANPGAYIDNISIAHSADPTDVTTLDDEAILTYINDSGEELAHSADEKTEVKKEEETKMADEKQKSTADGEKTIGDIFESMSEEQKNAVYAIVGAALEDDDDDDDEEDDGKSMKHNIFESEHDETTYLSHSAQEDIIKTAKSNNVGSFQTALGMFIEDNELKHDAISSGFTQDDEDGNVTWLFPEYKDVRPGAPELITNDQGWISLVLNKLHKSPISRIRTNQVDIRNIDELRAKGYVKGKQKSLTGNFKLARRTTDPQTIYVKNALHRDDIVDITDFDYVQYLYNIDRMMLNEELATAIMLGDGRDDGDADKISPEHIRPIWLDDDLYTMHVDIDLAAAKAELQGTDTSKHFGDNYVYAEAMVNTVLYAREKFKGTGTPDFYCTPHLLNQMLLARDINGRRIYSSKEELASVLNVGSIVTAEQFAGKQRTDANSKKKNLLGIIVNLADYSLGATKGGEITHFTQFDIDFNQEKSLIETRCSGALTRVYSAIAIEEPVSTTSSGSSSDSDV